MIELKHISKTFPTADGVFQALDDINLTIRDGDIFGIVGMSGAGKSTLVRRARWSSTDRISWSCPPPSCGRSAAPSA